MGMMVKVAFLVFPLLRLNRLELPPTIISWHGATVQNFGPRLLCCFNCTIRNQLTDFTWIWFTEHTLIYSCWVPYTLYSIQYRFISVHNSLPKMLTQGCTAVLYFHSGILYWWQIFRYNPTFKILLNLCQLVDLRNPLCLQNNTI